ncbi:MAG: hypothetical protein ACPGQL_00755 [Thermoplasmatota archaeon]
MRSLLLAATVALAAIAGCLDDDEPATDDVGSAPATSMEDTPALHNETVTGDATTTMFLWVGAALFDEGASFPVKSDATELIVNITADMVTPTDYNVRLAPEGCDTLSGSCSYYVDMASGEGQFTLKDPEAGTWSVAFFTNQGVAVGSYELEIVQFLAAEEPTDAATDDDAEAPCDPAC